MVRGARAHSGYGIGHCITARGREHFPVRLVELALHERAGVLDRLIVDGRSHGVEKEIDDLLGPESAEVFVELLEVESLQRKKQLIPALVGKGDGQEYLR